MRRFRFCDFMEERRSTQPETDKRPDASPNAPQLGYLRRDGATLGRFRRCVKRMVFQVSQRCRVACSSSPEPTGFTSTGRAPSAIACVRCTAGVRRLTDELLKPQCGIVAT